VGSFSVTASNAQPVTINIMPKTQYAINVIQTGLGAKLVMKKSVA